MNAFPSGEAPARAGKLGHLLLFVLLGAALLALFAAELSLGTVRVPSAGVFSWLLGGSAGKETWDVILGELRLPRAAAAALGGAALAVGGLILQTLFRNPLAGPWALGITAGAQLGVAMVVVAGAVAGSTAMAAAFARAPFLAELSLSAGAVAGAVAMLVAIGLLARRTGAVTLLIVGLMAGFLAQGLVGVLLHFTTENQATVYSTWSDGSFGGVTRAKLAILAPAVLGGLALAFLLIKSLNALLLGERYAQSLGLDATRVRQVALLAVAALSGSVTAYCGPVLFLDLAVPHLCRFLLRSADHRVLVPATTLLGAVLALAADLVVHLPWRHHFLHLNTVHALIGAPVVLWVVLRERRSGELEL